MRRALFFAVLVLARVARGPRGNGSDATATAHATSRPTAPQTALTRQFVPASMRWRGLRELLPTSGGEVESRRKGGVVA